MNFTRSSSETMTSFQATLVNTGYGQLVLRDSLGKVSQKWTLSNPKCVIGSGTNCNVSCQLPGIADHHVLMVIGAKQVFIRALANGLTRNGQNITEIVISGSEPDFEFELAGHHFQFSRTGIAIPVVNENVRRDSVSREFVQEPAAIVKPAATMANDAPQLRTSSIDQTEPVTSATAAPGACEVLPANRSLTPSRLKFTVVRALEKNRQSSADSSATTDTGLAANRPAWVEAIVRDALRPVEERLDDLNGPLQNIERRLRRQRSQMRKARKARREKAELAPAQPQVVAVLAPELIQSQAIIEQFVQSQAKQLELLTQNVQQVIARLTDMDRQLSSNQDERLELSHQFQQSNQQIVAMQRELSVLMHGIQTQLAEPATKEAAAEVRLWQSNVEAQLAELQATLLALDDIKSTLQAAADQNRALKSDLEAQPQRMVKQVTEAIQKVMLEVSLPGNVDSESMHKLVADRVCDSLRELLGSRFTNEVAQQLSDSLNNDFAAPLASQLSNQLTSELNQQMHSSAQNAPLAPAGVQADEMVLLMRQTLAEMLAPLQDSLQLHLQQTIQQAVDASLQQTVEQTLAPMIEATTSAQIRAAVTPLQFQLPNVQPPAAQPTTSPVATPAVDPVQSYQIPAEQPSQGYASAGQFVAGNNMVEGYPEGQAAYADAQQGFDSQPYTPMPTYDQQRYSAATQEPPQAHDSQAYQSPAYDSQAYPSQAYDSQAYDSQAYDSQPYGSQGYSSHAYDSQAYTASPEPASPEPASPEPAAAPTESPSEEPSEQPVAESHAQQLPSWWSDDGMNETPAQSDPVDSSMQRGWGAAQPLNADFDAAAFDPHAGAFIQDSSRPELGGYGSSYPTGHDHAAQPEGEYAQSAFSAEQLELDAGVSRNYDEAAGQSNAYQSDAYQSDPYQADRSTYADSRYAPTEHEDGPESLSYSDLVNRKRPVEPEEPADTFEQPEFAGDRSPYSDRAMVSTGSQAFGSVADEDYAAADTAARIAQPDHLTQSVPARDNPTVPATEAQPTEDGDESVEDYMRRLLARMRGVSESEVTVPGGEPTKPVNSAPLRDPSVAQPSRNVVTAAVPEPADAQVSEAWTEPFDPDKYVPRGSAPEKNRDLNALRELANTSARSAIQVSARRRHGTAILIKSAISMVGLIAGIALVSINGARINIAFIATVASFLVALIWGYDAITSIRPLLQARHQPKQRPNAEPAAAPSTDTAE